MTGVAGQLVVTLDVGSVTDEHGDLGATLTVTVRNVGSSPVEARLESSTLLVDGEPYDSWTLAAGNGAAVARTSPLRPDEQTRLARRVGLSPFDPGVHELVIEVGGAASEPRTLLVPRVDPTI